MARIGLLTGGGDCPGLNAVIRTIVRSGLTEAPGAIATAGATGGAVDPDVTREPGQRIPMHRMGLPDDMGRVALFLACGLSSYLTGSQVVADSGMLLR